MTALLLDTSAFAMVLVDDPRLPSLVLEQIATADRCALSAISLYEIGQKTRLGKWPEMAPHVADLAALAHEAGVELLPLSPAVALRAAVMNWDHRDPFDRIIAATAQDEALILISPDVAFDAAGVDRFWRTAAEGGS